MSADTFEKTEFVPVRALPHNQAVKVLDLMARGAGICYVVMEHSEDKFSLVFPDGNIVEVD